MIDGLSPAQHHELLIGKIQALIDGTLTNDDGMRVDSLMVFMPPGSAKSTYATVLTPAWFAAKFPKKNVLCVSCSDDLAGSFGKRTRNIVGGQEYYDITGVSLASDSTASDDWATNTGTSYRSTGIGGQITGFRADLGIIDDPTKGAAEARSPAIKRRNKEWYTSDFTTRLKPKAKKLLIMTRWDEDDLAGWLLEEAKKGGEQWAVLRLPMLAEANDPLGREPGEQLWKEWFTPEMVKQAQRNETTWNALYQQRPAPLEGSFFKREMLRWYSKLPSDLKFYMTSDYAVSDSGGDWTVLIVFGVDEFDNIYIVDMFRAQVDSLIWCDKLCDLILQYRPLMLGEEKGVILKAVEPFIVKRMRERSAFVYRVGFPSSTHKEARAAGIQARSSMGMVFLPEHAEWLADFIHELLTFPAGKNDDMVDAFGLIGRMLDMLAKAAGKDAERPPIKTLQEATFDEILEAHDSHKPARQRI